MPTLHAAVAALVFQLGPSAAGQTWDLPVLQRFLGFTENEWQQVDRGTVVARTLRATDGREFAVVSAVRSAASSACFIAQFQDIEKFKKSPLVLEVRRFSDPPVMEDLASMMLDGKDVAGLSACQSGNCSVRLPAEAMELIHRGEADRHTAFRRWLLSYVQAFKGQGNAALVAYHDKSQPVRLADELSALLNAKPSLADLAPEVYSYLARYPAAPLPGAASEFSYWSRENFGLRAVVSVTHASVHRQPGQAIIATKQIYANHYFDGSLGLTFLIDVPGASPEAVYVVYLNRSRIDLLSGVLGGLRRLILRGRLLEGYKENLREMVKRLDSSCGAGKN